MANVTRVQSFQHIWHLLREDPRTTRTELVERSGLSKATVSEAISLLLQRGIIAEVGKRDPARGRRQVVLELQAATRTVIGAQFTESGCHAVLADLTAAPLAWADRAVSGSEPEAYIAALAECVDELRATTTAPILGAGIGVPGLVSADGRNVIVSVPFSWEDVPIGDLLEERLHLPIVAINRAKSAALGEYWQGETSSLADRQHLAYVHIGAGIVAGFVYGGQLLVGHSGAAGELGHITMLPDGPTCACGNQGCLHMLASESAILRDVRARLRRRGDSGRRIMNFEDVKAALDDGDEVVREVVQDAGRWIGMAIANMINVMNPGIVAIGGSVADLGDVFMDRVRQEVQRRALWEVLQGVSITRSALGETAGTIGGAALFIDSLDIEQIIG